MYAYYQSIIRPGYINMFFLYYYQITGGVKRWPPSLYPSGPTATSRIGRAAGGPGPVRRLRPGGPRSTRAKRRGGEGPFDGGGSHEDHSLHRDRTGAVRVVLGGAGEGVLHAYFNTGTHSQ